MTTPDLRRPPVAWTAVASLCGVKLALHAYSTLAVAYGYSVDELYFLSCAARPDWGYVDHPPLSIAVLSLVTGVFGDSLVAIRVVPALLGAGAILCAGLLARELSGGRSAQLLAGLAVLVAPSFLAMGSFYSLNAFDQLLWPLAALVLARLFHTGETRLWWLVGVLVGLGLLNKWSMAWFALGLAAGIALTAERRWLATRWPWLAAAVAAAIAAPHLVWQVEHGWPTLDFIANNQKEYSGDVVSFLRGQFQAHHPATLPLSCAGLVYYFGAAGRRQRVLGWIFVFVFGLLLASGRASPYYLSPAYPLLFAGGAVFLERLAERRALRWLPAALAALLVLGGSVVLPLSLPLLSPSDYVAYGRESGLSAGEEGQAEDSGPLPLHFAIRFGARELALAVAEAYAALPKEEQERVAVLTTTFGESGALEHHARELGLPPVIGTHVSFGLWGPGDVAGELLLVVAAPDAPLLAHFEEVEWVGEVDCRWCMPELAARRVYLCRRPRRPLRDLWPGLVDYR